MPKKILIVDDNAINRQLLGNALCADYDILEAESGQAALELLGARCATIAAVLLDIVMPGMDGYELLRRMRGDARLAQIPVVMVTASEDDDARVKALLLGANDFIVKPFNPDIVKHCLKNNIALRETASMLNVLQRDKLTGLYSREAFFERVAGLIQEHEPGYYLLSCFDIDHFKLINDQYGAAEGDRLLREVGRAVGENAQEIGGIAGRISADNFAALFPADRKVTAVLQRILDKRLVSLDRQSVSFSVGRYLVTDLTLPASAIYDRAFIAKQSVKGRYDAHLAYFDDAMLEKLVRDQQITGEMETALETRQFETWFQPQYNHATGALTGAEALVRWRHPQKGVIAPGAFIPLFEQNGFIYEMDKYVWREVCRYLRKWMDEGRAPLPVSVNISRYDIFRADLIDVLTGCVREFGVPVELMRLEITESAFTTSAQDIVRIVRQLVELGFTVEIDDFGSGYSSLNTLKNVPAQVVKLDMRFLDGGGDSRRGGNILESIVRMTKWLGMTVLAEGVEDLDQADFLKSIGCSYVQGYLYARPMPADEFEALLSGVRIEQHPFVSGSDRLLASDAFWDPESLDSLVFNRYSGGACVYEFHDGQIEMIRATDKYIRTVFGPGMTADDAMRLNWREYVDAQTERALSDALETSLRTLDEVSGEYLFLNLPRCPRETWLRSTLRVIAATDDRYLVYCTSVNLSSQRAAERKNAAIAERLQAVMDNVSCGITAVTYGENGVEYLMINDRYYALLGYTRAQCADLSAFSPVCEADRQRVADSSRRVYADGAPATLEYRARRRDGSVIWLREAMTMTRFAGIDAPVQLSIFTDITAERELLEKLRVSEEINRLAIQQSREVVCRYDVATRRLSISPGANPIFELSPVEADVPERSVREGKISPDTAEAYVALFERIRKGEKSGQAQFQRRSTLGWRWLEVHYTTIFSDDGEPVTAVISYTDVTESLEKDAAYRKWRQSLRERRPTSYSLYHCNLSKNSVLSAPEGSLIPPEMDLSASQLDAHTALYARKYVFEADAGRFADRLNRQALLARHAQGRGTDTLEFREKQADGGVRWLRLTIDLLDAPCAPDVEAYLLFENIDEAKRAELEMIERADTDPLTGVLNRAAFARRADERMRAAGPGARHALLMLDIDGFKLVNDVFGHGAGDQTLNDIAALLRKSTRRDDLVGRLGGDEFVVFLSELPDEAVAGRKARQICELTRKALSAEVHISCSVGIALCPRDGDNFETLYKRADETLYYVKGRGKNSYAFYRADMAADAAEPRADARIADAPGGRMRRMLIVDDSPLDFELLANLFRTEFNIEKARDGASALIKLHHYGSAIAIVLLDLMMPGMDGFAVLEKMRQSAEMKSVPVIVVSGAANLEASLKAIRAGAADFVTKPIDPELLRIRVSSAISRADNERLRAQNSFLEMQSGEMDSYKTVLERTGTLVVIHDWVRGGFTYCPSISAGLAGKYDDRSLWYILLSDLVTDSQTVQRMQQLAHDVANDRRRTCGEMRARMKTPSGKSHAFEMKVYKQANEFGLTDKLVLTFRDLDAKPVPPRMDEPDTAHE